MPRGVLAVIGLPLQQNDQAGARGLAHPLPESARRLASLAAVNNAVYVSWRLPGYALVSCFRDAQQQAEYAPDGATYSQTR
jgi:hypothetical protein